MFGKIILEKHNPIVLVRVHLVHIDTADGAMCHAMSCKHTVAPLGFKQGQLLLALQKNKNCYKITCIHK